MAASSDPIEPKNGRVYQHFRSFLKALEAYVPGEPLSRFLTGFFKENKQMGSKDRKAVSRFAYHYFRLGNAAKELEIIDRLVLAEFLCTTESLLVQSENPGLNEHIQIGLDEKINLLETTTSFRMVDVFPLLDYISPLIDRQAFIRQFFIQPDLFLRMRRGQEDRILTLLDTHAIAYRRIGETALALPNSTSLEQIPGLKGLVEVQDLSSQRSMDKVSAQKGESWWDACSGAGGKSLMLMDRFPGIQLLVSDIRPSILRNLDERFEAAGIRGYRRKIIDLTKDTAPVLGDEQFDGILLDAPCTGSGTWGRTPEMLLSFGEPAITESAELQKSIAAGVVRHLKPGKPLFYITCSVFATENEEVVSHICQQTGLHAEAMEYINGYHDRADTLFVARLV